MVTCHAWSLRDGGQRSPMPPSPLRRLARAGPAVGQRARGRLGEETALPQNVRRARVVQKGLDHRFAQLRGQ
jgi:hypothetical protein